MIKLHLYVFNNLKHIRTYIIKNKIKIYIFTIHIIVYNLYLIYKFVSFFSFYNFIIYKIGHSTSYSIRFQR